MKLSKTAVWVCIGIFFLAAALLVGGCASGKAAGEGPADTGTVQVSQDLQSRVDEAMNKADQAIDAAEEARARAEDCCNRMEQALQQAQQAARDAQDAARKSEAIFNKMTRK